VKNLVTSILELNLNKTLVWGNRRERDHTGDLGVDGRIILGRISRRWDVGIWIRLGWPRIEIGGGCLCGNELSGSVKCGEFLD